MQIIMLETRQASPNGINVQLFKEGSTYDVPDELGKTMVREKWARPVPAAGTGAKLAPDETSKTDRTNHKHKPAPTSDKALKGGKENK